MQLFEQAISAGQTLALAVAGDYFRLLTVPKPVDVRFYRNGAIVGEAAGMDTGFYMLPEGGFEKVEVYSADAQTVRLLITRGRAGYDHFNVELDGVVEILQMQARTIVDRVGLTVGTSAVQVAAANSTRRGLRLMNMGSVDVYLGGSAVSLGGSPLKVGPGQLWIESEAAAAAWYAIASAEGQGVRVQEVLA